MKTTLTIEMSKKSLKNAKAELIKYKKAYEMGIDNAIKKATEALYYKVLEHCYDNGISNHTDAIHWEYDDDKKVGKVYTNDWVIIFNEMGTGVMGANNPHPNPTSSFKGWKYDVNEYGEKGWKYPKSNGTFGWTKGLPSRHMFYDAFEDIKSEIGDTVAIEIRKSVGDLY